MFVSEEDREKLETLKKKLSITFKASTSSEQRGRLKKQMDELEVLLKDIADGKRVDLSKFNVFSKLGKNTIKENINEINEENIERIYKFVEIKKIASNSRDYENDLVYSYFQYFEEQLYPCLTPQNLKLRYDAGKKRDGFLLTTDILKKDFKNFKEDVENEPYVRGEEQGHRYEERLINEKRLLILKLTDFFQKILSFIEVIHQAQQEGDTIILEPEKIIEYVPTNKSKGIYNGMMMKDFINELEEFINSFLNTLKLPSFIKNNIQR